MKKLIDSIPGWIICSAAIAAILGTCALIAATDDSKPRLSYSPPSASNTVTKRVDVPTPPAALDAENSSLMPNKPVDLKSANATNAPAQAPRIPVYVIPDAIVVQTPTGVIVFAPELHVQELVRKFPSSRVTNTVIWSR